MKLNEGAPKLRYTIEMGGKKGKASRHFHEEAGYILMRNGDRYEGFLTLRAERMSGEPWKLSQVEFREDQKKPKQKLPPEEVVDFAMNFTMADYQPGNDPAKNLTQGSLKLVDGTELQGFVCLARIWSAGSIGGAGSRAVYYAENESANIQEFKPGNVQELVQARSDGEAKWIQFEKALIPVMINGSNYQMFRNPHPTTRATGLKAGLRGFAGDVAGGVAADQVGKAAAKGEAKQRIKNGESVGAVVRGADAAGQGAYDATAAAFSEIDLRGFKTEYVIRHLQSGTDTIVTDNNVEERIGSIVSACPTMAGWSPAQRKDQLKFANLPTLVTALDKCF